MKATINWIGDNLTGLAQMGTLIMVAMGRWWSHREHKQTERKVDELVNGK